MKSITLPDILLFEWDEGNLEKNKKHNVTNKESEEVFYDEQKIIFKDIKHSTKLEKRYVLFGKTMQGKMFFIAYTLRGEQKEKVRIISARILKKKERDIYEKAIGTT